MPCGITWPCISHQQQLNFAPVRITRRQNQQYFIRSDLDGVTFNREQPSPTDPRANGENDFEPFAEQAADGQVRMIEN